MKFCVEIDKESELSELETESKSIDENIRDTVLRRDDFKCRWCGREAENIHHMKFRSQGGSDNPINLVALCFDCHRKIHDPPSHFWRKKRKVFITPRNAPEGVTQYDIENETV